MVLFIFTFPQHQVGIDNQKLLPSFWVKVQNFMEMKLNCFSQNIILWPGMHSNDIEFNKHHFLELLSLE